MDRDLIYIFLGLFVIGIFTFKPIILIRQRTFKLITVISALEFAIGIILHFTQEPGSTVGALLAPLPTMGYFRVCLRTFLSFVHREPIDVAYNWNSGLFKDRVFALAFVFGGLLIFALTTFGLQRLAKASW